MNVRDRMRRVRTAPLLLALLLAVAIGLPSAGTLSAMAATTGTLDERLADAVVFSLGCPVARVRNSLVLIDPNNLSVQPFAADSRTLLPVTFLSQSFGATVGWDGTTGVATVTLGSTVIRIRLNDSTMEVNGTRVPLDIPARSSGGRMFVPLRSLCAALGKEVYWHASGLVVVSDTKNILDPVADAALIDMLRKDFRDPVQYQDLSVQTKSGAKTVHVATIQPQDPRIRFEVGLPEGKLDRTADFAAMVKAKGARVAINANFFLAYGDIKDPIGHVMADGRLLYGQSGLTGIGITKDKHVFFSVPGIFTRMFADGKKMNKMVAGGQIDYNTWDAYEVNTRSQSTSNAILYTPARGASINITAAGSVVTVRNGVIESLVKVTPPTSMLIPSDGYCVFFGDKVTAQWVGSWDLDPGRTVALEHYLFKNTNPDFILSDMQWMMSGGPDLVVNGAVAPVSTSATFADARFTTSSTPRTAVGQTADGQLLLITTPSAKISDLKEIMLSLGCRQAINLDGGGSCGMSVDGKTIMTPGRKLATMFYVYDR